MIDFAWRCWQSDANLSPVGRGRPEFQFASYTSELGRKIGKALKVSPALVDYVITGFGGSLGKRFLQGTNLAVERIEGKPRVASGAEDAFLVRRFAADPARGSDSQKTFYDLMNRTGGRLTEAEGSFRRFVRDGDQAGAVAYLNDLKPHERAYVLLVTQKGGRDFHPLERAREVNQVIGDMRREVRDGTISATPGGRPIALTPEQRRQADDALAQMSATEMRNALSMVGVRGWAQRDPVAVGDSIAALQAADSQLGKALGRRLTAAGVLRMDQFEQVWEANRGKLEREATERRWGRLFDQMRARAPLTSGTRPRQSARSVRALDNLLATPPGNVGLGALPHGSEVRPANSIAQNSGSL